RPKTAIKAQALADFVAEFTPSAEEEKLVSKKKESSRADKTSTEPDQPRDMWQLRVDGASNQKEAGAGVVIITPDGTLLEQAITLGFPASNNEAEYEALLVLGKGAINQKAGHLLRFPADHKSSLRRIHGEAPEDDVVP
ncbi:unnamed protein product, partial [Prunus brigantina]